MQTIIALIKFFPNNDNSLSPKAKGFEQITISKLIGKCYTCQQEIPRRSVTITNIGNDGRLKEYCSRHCCNTSTFAIQ